MDETCSGCGVHSREQELRCVTDDVHYCRRCQPYLFEPRRGPSPSTRTAVKYES